MPNTYPTPPAYTPGAGQGGYWYRPPFTPRFSIPQTFGEALSYEAQIHWLASLCSDADSMMRTLSAMHLYYGTAPVDTSTFTAYEPFTYTDAAVPEADQPKVGDFVGLVVPDADTRYLGKNALHIARVVEWGRLCDHLTLAWYCTVHDPTAWLADMAGQIGELETRVTSLATRMTAAEMRIETVEDTVAQHGDAVTALQASVQNLTAAVTDIESDLTALTQTVTQHTAALAAHTKTLGELQDGLRGLETRTQKTLGELQDGLRGLGTRTQKTLADIVAKVYGGGTVNRDTGAVTWGNGATIPVGNINIYSADGKPSPSTSAGIITHANVLDNDLWQK